MLETFKARNPYFQGGVSVVGHSLGACVLFDLLDHQQSQEVNNDVFNKPSEPSAQIQEVNSAQRLAGTL